MTPYGGDRVRTVGDRILLSCRVPKGWTARVERSLNQSEFPGTAVLWDDEFFEVIGVETLPNGVRYALEPWRDHHAMRVSERYDADSEARRAAEWRAAHVRESKRKTAGALSLLTGHLPAIVQERLASEVGVLASRMTFISLIGTLAVIIALAMYIGDRLLANEPAPKWAVLLAGALFIENAFRFVINWLQSRPVGSMAGTFLYIAYWLLTGAPKQSTPFASLPGYSVTISETPGDLKLRDAMTMREPLATLLPVADQQRLAARHGYDYRRSARVVAGILLTFSLLGIITSVRSGAITSLIAAIVISGEQIIRFIAFRQGPAPSLLGFLVRPLMRGLL